MRARPVYAFSIARHGAYAVVHAEGELDLAAAPELEASARAAALRSRCVVVDLRAVTFMDTFALRTLIALQRSADADPRLSLHVLAGPAVQRLLDLAGARAALRWIAAEQLAG